MDMAAIMDIARANRDGKLPNWKDFIRIVCLLVINSTTYLLKKTMLEMPTQLLWLELLPKRRLLEIGAGVNNKLLF